MRSMASFKAIIDKLVALGISTAAGASAEQIATNIGTLATSKYNAGVRDADNRANPSSANYQAGRSSVKARYTLHSDTARAKITHVIAPPEGVSVIRVAVTDPGNYANANGNSLIISSAQGTVSYAHSGVVQTMAGVVYTITNLSQAIIVQLNSDTDRGNATVAIQINY